jgi:CHAT domain-containing protein
VGILGLGGIKYGSGEFRFLPKSEEEVRAVVEMYRRQTEELGPPLIGSSATEELLKSLKSPPRVLHLATHGFFEPRPDHSPASVRRPLVLSGVALAGATFTGEASSDGILYAIEAQDLNLEGTELVVLSACKSAQGYIEKGEGVHGLTRAFGIAGAGQTLVALRPVDDAEAALFSETFYREWLGGGGSPSDAFKATLQTILSKWPHLDWTAYALFGVAEGS